MKFWRTIVFPIAAMMTVVPTTRAAPDTFPDVNDLPVRKEMPDAMTMNDGTKVTTIAQWRARREEMKAILEHYELGHAPPPPGNVSGEDVKSGILLDGTVKYRLVHLKFGPEENPGFDIAIFTPREKRRPVSDHHQSVVFQHTGRCSHEYPSLQRR